MDRYTTLIDHESATKALAALSEIDPRALSQALSNALSRKIGSNDSPVPTDESLPSKFERFFDTIFNVAPEEKPMPVETVIELVDVAIKGLNEDIAHERDSAVTESLETMFIEDREDYEKMRALLVSGDIRGAVDAYKNTDTAVRERLFGRTPTEEYQLSIFLTENGY